MLLICISFFYHHSGLSVFIGGFLAGSYFSDALGFYIFIVCLYLPVCPLCLLSFCLLSWVWVFLGWIFRLGRCLCFPFCVVLAILIGYVAVFHILCCTFYMCLFLTFSWGYSWLLASVFLPWIWCLLGFLWVFSYIPLRFLVSMVHVCFALGVVKKCYWAAFSYTSESELLFTSIFIITLLSTLNDDKGHKFRISV